MSVIIEPEEPVAPNRPGVALKIAVALALVVATVLAFLPPLAIQWYVGASYTSWYDGQTLALTGGLEQDVFEQCYWLSFGIDVAFIVWGLVRLTLRREHPWRPLFWLVVVYALAYGTLVTLDAQSEADIADGLTTTVVLGLAWLWKYVLPILWIVLVVKVDVLLWRATAASMAVARRVVAGSVVAALAVGYVAASGVVSGPDLEHESPIAELDLDPGDARGERLIYVRAAAAITTRSERTMAEQRDRSVAFVRCMNELGAPRPDARTELDRAIRKLARSMREADAEDLAYESLLKVCAKHAKDGVLGLAAYFWKAIKNRAATLCRRNARFDLVASDELPEYGACERFADSVEGRELMQVLARLTPEEQRILQLHYFDGRTFAEVGTMLGITEAAARKRSERALSSAYRVMAAR